MSRLSDSVNSPSASQGSSFLGGKSKSRANSKASSVIAGEKVVPPPANNSKKVTPHNSFGSGISSVDASSLNHLLGSVDGVPLGSTLPPVVRNRLADLFGQIVQEFEILYAENETLQQQLGVQSDRLQGISEASAVGRMHGSSFTSASSSPPTSSGVGFANELTPTNQPAPSSNAKTPNLMPIQGSSTTSSTKTTRPIQISQKIKTTYKASQSKILSSFKGGITNPMSTGGNNQVRLFKGHRDGVWDLAVSRHSPIVLGTASADFTARIWCMENEACLLQYVGHTGSVNSIRFHPSQDLALTSSGDGTAHLWRAVVSLPSNLELINKCQSSGEEELEGSEDDNLYERDAFNDSVPNSGSFCVPASSNHPDQSYIQANHSMSPPNSTNVLSFNNHQSAAPASSASQSSIGPHAPETSFPTVRHPVVVLSGHTDVVVAADWIHGGSQLVTASWDRTANLYDAETHSHVQSLTGHDQELTNVTCHPDQKLIVTSSKDTTFRLWDFRSLHSVNIFQGHSQPVTTAVFAGTDKVVSGSDDRTVRVWDLKNMRAPLTTIRTDSSVNRLTVSKKNWIAIPCDNRHVKLYHLNGERLGRLRRSNRQGHRRMVTSTAWVDSNSTACNLVTSAFDRKVLGWSVVETNKDNKDHKDNKDSTNKD